MNRQHLSRERLGPNATAALVALAAYLEGKWRFGIEGADFADADDTIRQRIDDLKAQYEVFKAKKASLVQFKTNKTYRTTTPTFLVPLKAQPGSRIATASFEVGDVIYITGDVALTSPLELLLLQDND